MANELIYSDIDPTTSFARVEEDGVFRIYDIKTFNLLMERDPEKCPKEFLNQFLNPPKKKFVKYHPYYGDLIVDRMLEGHTLKQISQMKGFPSYAVIQRWLLHHLDFEEKVTKAMRAVGQFAHDSIMDMAQTMEDELSIEAYRAAKLKSELLKWGAKVNNPEKFGDKTEIQADVNHATTIIVETGIRRDPLNMDEQGVINAEYSHKKGIGESNSTSERTRVEGQKSKDGDN